MEKHLACQIIVKAGLTTLGTFVNAVTSLNVLQMCCVHLLLFMSISGSELQNIFGLKNNGTYWEMTTFCSAVCVRAYIFPKILTYERTCRNMSSLCS